MTDYLARRADPQYRFYAALALSLPYLLIRSLTVKGGLFVILIILVLLSGRKIRMGLNLILAGSLIFFQLLTPLGEVLAEIGPLMITEGALERGVMKSLTLLGLMFISLASIRPGITLPGRFGKIMAGVFYYFARFLDRKDTLEGKNFFDRLDDILLDVYRESPEEGGERAESGHRGRLVLFLLSLIFWLAYGGELLLL